MSPAEILDALPGVHVLVFGDPMIDVYHFGHSERLSPEAPVPVFIEERLEKRHGGAANVAANLEALGCMVTTAFPPKPWTEKHRYMVGHHQLFRHDKDFISEGEIWVPMTRGQQGVSAVVISDYAKGACTERGCAAVIQASTEMEIPVVVDPKGTEWEKYRGSSVVCPNEQEYERARRADYGRFLNAFPTLLLKRGERGIRLIRRDVLSGLLVTDDFHATARHVFDVTGAGDTVTAVVAAAMGAGANLQSAAQLANIAAGYVVGEVGTAVCPIEKLRELVSA